MNRNSRSNGAVFGFVLGAAVGAGLTLLLAPQSGAATRGIVGDAARRVTGDAKEKLGRAREKLENLKEKVTPEEL